MTIIWSTLVKRIHQPETCFIVLFIVCVYSHLLKDGKSYDAYVSYLHGNELGLSSTMTFALHSLPAVLEEHFGYKLFISGRDELPGEGKDDQSYVPDETICRALTFNLT